MKSKKRDKCKRYKPDAIANHQTGAAAGSTQSWPLPLQSKEKTFSSFSFGAGPVKEHPVYTTHVSFMLWFSTNGHDHCWRPSGAEGDLYPLIVNHCWPLLTKMITLLIWLLVAVFLSRPCCICALLPQAVLETCLILCLYQSCDVTLASRM